MHIQRKLTRNDHRAVQILVLITTVLFGYILLYMFATIQGDFAAHIGFSIHFAEYGIARVPHLLYHVLVIALVKLLPSLDYTSAGLIVCLAFYAVTPIILYRIVRPAFLGTGWRPSLLASFFTIALMFVTNVNLFTLPQQDLYFGYIAINTFHNPTMILLKPFALVTFIFALAVLQNRIAFSPGVALGGGLLTTLCMFAKPNYMICLLPALTIISAVKWVRREPMSWRLFVISLAVPTVVTFVVQYLIAFGGESDNAVILAPLAWLREPLGILLIKLILSALFPLFVCLLHWSTARKDLALTIGWLSFAVGAAQVYLLDETGVRSGDGNFVWSAQITLFVLFVYSVIFVLQQKGGGWRWWVCVTAFVLHLISGFVFLVFTLTS